MRACNDAANLEMGLANDAANLAMGPGNDTGASTDCVRQPGPKEVSTDSVSQQARKVVLGRGQTMGLLRVAVLGSPEVFHDGSRLTFALRKAQALLLYLAVEGGLHPRSKLAALLWPDSEPHDARTALRNAITLLRSLLADPHTASVPHTHLLS